MTVKRKNIASRETQADGIWKSLIYSPHFTNEETEAERMPVMLPVELAADLGCD